jgi:hypothetical protein
VSRLDDLLADLSRETPPAAPDHPAVEPVAAEPLPLVEPSTETDPLGAPLPAETLPSEEALPVETLPSEETLPAERDPLEDPPLTETAPVADLPLTSSAALELPGPAETLESLLGGPEEPLVATATPAAPPVEPSGALTELADQLDAVEASVENPLHPIAALIEGIELSEPTTDQRIDRIAELRGEASDRLSDTDELIAPENDAIGLSQSGGVTRLESAGVYLDPTAETISGVLRGESSPEEVSFVVRSVREQRGSALVDDARSASGRRTLRRVRDLWLGPLGWSDGSSQGRIVSRLGLRLSLGLLAVLLLGAPSIGAVGSAWGEPITTPLAGSLARPPLFGLGAIDPNGGNGADAVAAGSAYVGLLRAYLAAAESGDTSGLSAWALPELSSVLAGEIAEFGRRGLRPTLTAGFELLSPFAPGWESAETVDGVRQIRGTLLGPVELSYTNLDGSPAGVYPLERLDLIVRQLPTGAWRVAVWNWVAEQTESGVVTPTPLPEPSATPTPTATPKPAVTPKPTAAPVTSYVVRSGDTIRSIACKLSIGCSAWEELAAANAILGPEYPLTVGDLLSVPR